MPSLVLSSTEVGILSKAVLNRNSRLRLLATGGSMLPAIRHEDILIVEPRKSSIRPRDILLFQNQSGRVIAHRVIRVNAGKNYLMCGDANPQPDGWITEAQILGVVTGIERKGKLIAVNSFQRMFHSMKITHCKNLRYLLNKVGCGFIFAGCARKNETTIPYFMRRYNLRLFLAALRRSCKKGIINEKAVSCRIVLHIICDYLQRHHSSKRPGSSDRY